MWLLPAQKALLPLRGQTITENNRCRNPSQIETYYLRLTLPFQQCEPDFMPKSYTVLTMEQMGKHLFTCLKITRVGLLLQPVYDIISLSFIWTPIGRDVHAIKMKDYSQNHHKTQRIGRLHD